MNDWGCDARLLFYSKNHTNGLAFYLQSNRVFYFENDGVPVFCSRNVQGVSCFENVQAVFCSENDNKVFCSENVDKEFCFERNCDSVEFFSSSCVSSLTFEEHQHFSLNH